MAQVLDVGLKLGVLALGRVFFLSELFGGVLQVDALALQVLGVFLRDLVAQLCSLLDFFNLRLQKFYVRRKLAAQALDLAHVFGRFFQLALGLLALVQKGGEPERVLYHFAALLYSGGEHPIGLALGDNMVPRCADVGLAEELRDIAQGAPRSR